MLKNIGKTIFALAVLGIFTYAFSSYLGVNFDDLYNRYFPCRRPIVYTIGSFDDHFGVTKENFLKAVKEAEAIWEKPLDRDLFTYDADKDTENDLKINLIYDFRQQATNKIKTLVTNSTNTRASYDALKSTYESEQRDYLEAKKIYNQKISAFKKSPSREGLAEIRGMERDLNEQVSGINNLVTQINNLAKELNLNVAVLNNINETRGEEFTQGEYKSSTGTEEINIYEFNNHEKLVRLIAHELGHALGLEHVKDPNAIMYYLNENKTGKLTTEDLDAIKTRCGILK